MSRINVREVWNDFNQNGVDCGPCEVVEPGKFGAVGDKPWPKSTKRNRRRGGKLHYCSFCKNNGEPEVVYLFHQARNCARLWAYTCPTCNKNGHTKRYCPLKKIIRPEEIEHLP